MRAAVAVQFVEGGVKKRESILAVHPKTEHPVTMVDAADDGLRARLIHADHPAQVVPRQVGTDA